MLAAPPPEPVAASPPPPDAAIVPAPPLAPVPPLPLVALLALAPPVVLDPLLASLAPEGPAPAVLPDALCPSSPHAAKTPHSVQIRSGRPSCIARISTHSYSRRCGKREQLPYPPPRRRFERV